MVRSGEGTLPRGAIWAEGSGAEIHALLQALLSFPIPLGERLVSEPQSLPSTLHVVNHSQGGLGATGSLMRSYILHWELPTQMTSTNLVTWSWVRWRNKCCIWKEKLIIQIKWGRVWCDVVKALLKGKEEVMEGREEEFTYMCDSMVIYRSCLYCE